MDTAQQSPRFDAFISYSHAVEGMLAPELQRAIERYAKPWYRRRSLRIFRDTTNLSLSPNLWEEVATSLDQSRYLILLASPEAAQSRWVRKEIEHWLSSKDATTILIVLVAGDIFWSDELGDFDWPRTNALPKILAGAFKSEPLWADNRWARDPLAQLSMAEPRFAHTILALSASIRGRSMDELGGESVRQHRRTLRVVWGAGLVICLLALGATGFGFLAASSADLAEQRDQTVKKRESSRLADASRAELRRGNAIDAMHLALAALPSRFDVRQGWRPWASLGPDRPLVPDATGALLEALTRSREVLFLKAPRVANKTDEYVLAGFHGDGSRVFVVTKSGRYQAISLGASTDAISVDGPLNAISRAVVNRDGDKAVFVSETGEVVVWSPAGKFATRRLAQSLSESQDVQASLDGTTPRLVITPPRSQATDKSHISVIDPIEDRTIFTLPEGGVTLIRTGSALILQHAAGGRRSYYDAITGEPATKPFPFLDETDSIQVSDDRSVIVARLNLSGAVVWLRDPNGSYRRSDNIDVASREDVVLSENGKLIAKKKRDGTVDLWDPRSRLVQTPVATRSSIRSISLDASAKRAIAILRDGSVAVWVAGPDGWSPGMRLTAGLPSIHGTYSVDGRQIVAGAVRVARNANGRLTMQACVGIWDVVTRQLLKTLDVPEQRWVERVDMHPSKDQVLAVTIDGILHSWKTSDSTLLFSIGAEAGVIKQAVFDHHGDFIWLATEQGKLLRASAVSGSIEQVVEIPPGTITSMSLDQSAKRVALGYKGLAPIVVSTAPPHDKKVFQISGPSGASTSRVIFIDNGRSLAVGDPSGRISVFDAASAALVSRYEGLSTPVVAIGENEKSRRIVAITDTDIAIWDRDKPEPWALLRETVSFLYSVAFAPAGDQIMTTRADGMVTIYSVPQTIEHLRETAGRVLTRPLSAELARFQGIEIP